MTGAAGQIAYSLLYNIGNGSVFGKDRPIILVLLDSTPMMGVLDDVTTTDKEEVAFKDLDVAILMGSMPRREGTGRKDLPKANVNIFKSQGAALEKYSKKSVKVIVVGNPANTNCLTASKSALSTPKENFSCLVFGCRVHPCNHYNQNIEYFHHPRKFPHVLSIQFLLLFSNYCLFLNFM
uniref:Malate dehydrogenase, cytoplasmic n=1 Tax=Microcebus murinus TaxID=30608 RepID=A0A8C5Y553_MICMU